MWCEPTHALETDDVRQPVDERADSDVDDLVQALLVLIEILVAAQLVRTRRCLLLEFRMRQDGARSHVSPFLPAHAMLRLEVPFFFFLFSLAIDHKRG